MILSSTLQYRHDRVARTQIDTSSSTTHTRLESGLSEIT